MLTDLTNHMGSEDRAGFPPWKVFCHSPQDRKQILFLKQAPASMETHGKVVLGQVMSKYIIYTCTHAMIVHSIFTPNRINRPTVSSKELVNHKARDALRFSRNR